MDARRREACFAAISRSGLAIREQSGCIRVDCTPPGGQEIGRMGTCSPAAGYRTGASGFLVTFSRQKGPQHDPRWDGRYRFYRDGSLLDLRASAGAQVTALCDTNRRRLRGDWRDIKGNFGPPGRQMDLSGSKTYTDFDRLLADPELDLIDICLPTAFHAEFATRALAAGKHVCCEKPMALNVADTRRMVRAAHDHGKLLMVAHVLPMFPEYRFAQRAIESGKYGRLLGGHFKRVISEPTWMRGFYDPAVIGGPMLDLHVHDAHFIRLLCGMPTRVHAEGRMHGEVVQYFNSQFSFPDPRLVVTATAGVIDQPARSFLHGYEIHLERATLVFEFAVIDGQPRQLMPCTLLPSRGRARQPTLGEGDPMEAFAAELKQVIRAVRTGALPAFLSADLARDAIELCHRQTTSVRKGTSVKVAGLGLWVCGCVGLWLPGPPRACSEGEQDSTARRTSTKSHDPLGLVPRVSKIRQLDGRQQNHTTPSGLFRG